MVQFKKEVWNPIIVMYSTKGLWENRFSEMVSVPCLSLPESHKKMSEGQSIIYPYTEILIHFWVAEIFILSKCLLLVPEKISIQ